MSVWKSGHCWYPKQSIRFPLPHHWWRVSVELNDACVTCRWNCKTKSSSCCHCPILVFFFFQFYSVVIVFQFSVKNGRRPAVLFTMEQPSVNISSGFWHIIRKRNSSRLHTGSRRKMPKRTQSSSICLQSVFWGKFTLFGKQISSEKF